MKQLTEVIKWKITDDYGVEAILTTTGLERNEVLELIEEYKESVTFVDCGALQTWLRDTHCLSNGTDCYITYR